MSSELLEIRVLRNEGSTSSVLKSPTRDEVYYYPGNIQPPESTFTTISSRRSSSFCKRTPIIDKYFTLDAEERTNNRKKTASKIKTLDEVFAVLDWSLRGDVDAAHDTAVDLLAECGSILIDALQYFYLEYAKTSKGGSQINLDVKFDVLINGLSRASKLSAEARLKAIIQVSKSKSRIVKAAIIDGSLILVNKRNKKSVKELLNWFVTKEQDDYVRSYAEEALAELT